MLRTGLADRDQVTHMVEAAREAHPERPGALDLPMWEIGRTWCHKRDPECGACVMAPVCPKHVDRASSVSGA
jgi:endonuclease III